NVVHTAEQHYDDLRHPETGAVWDREELLAGLAAVRDTIDRYARINEVTLGRKNSEAANEIDRHTLTIDRKHIQESLHRLETVNTANLHELVAVRNAVRRTLRLLGTEPIADMLDGITASLPALAAELEKPAPNFVIEDNGYVVHTHAAPVLKNVFMHLVRNAMDHGLESAEERV